MKSIVSVFLALVLAVVSSSVQADEFFDRLGRAALGAGLGSLVHGEHRDAAMAAGAVAGWMSGGKEDRGTTTSSSSGGDPYGGNPGVAAAAARGYADNASRVQAEMERRAYCSQNPRGCGGYYSSPIAYQAGIGWR